MANKVEYVREKFPITKTDSGMEINIKIKKSKLNDGSTIYNVNGNPIGHGSKNPALSALRFIAQGLEELEK